MMEFLEVIKLKQVDIYIALFTMFLGLILGLIVDFVKDKTQEKTRQSIHSHITSVTVTNIVEIQSNQINSSSNDEGLRLIIGVILFVTGIIYLFNRLEILNLFYYITVFIISLWSGKILYNLFNGKFYGWHWFANLVFYGVFFIATLYIVNKAITPNFSPKNFNLISRLINQNGLIGLREHFSFLDLRWFMFHFLGVILLFFSMIILSLSATYFAVMSNILSEDEPKSWFAKRTRKYAYFWRNIIIISILLCISYYLVSGNFFIWFEYQLPKEISFLINKILYGS
ncbi:hypothetical protein [Phocoenobacter skyensis]|nr:hypothetical protein [Pasteurella skyensis]